MWGALLTAAALAAEPTATRADYDQMVMVGCVYRFAHDDLDVEPELTPALSLRWQLTPRWIVGGSLELTLPEDGGSSVSNNEKMEASYVAAWPVRPELLAEWAPRGDVSSGLHLGAGLSARGATFWESTGYQSNDLPDEALFEDPVGASLVEARLSAGARRVLHPGIAVGVDVGTRVRRFVPDVGPIINDDLELERLSLFEPVLMVAAGGGALWFREMRQCGGIGGCRVD